MRFKSTIETKNTNDTPLVTFKDAILRCLPEKGGLYIPEAVPDLRRFFLYMDHDTNYKEMAAVLAANLLQGELNPYSASWVAESAFSFEPELKQLDERFSILHLGGGPTGVFKDFGIAFLAAVMEEFLKNASPVMVISAAQGDIGTSIASAFYKRKNMIAVILYPQGQVRGIDTEALLKNGGNIIPIQVNGSLDDCNRLIASLIRDREFSDRYRITCANAINPGRLLSQAFYYIYAFVKLKQSLQGGLIFSVPCGNFGNLIGGLYAWKFGLPVKAFIAAQNINNPMADIAAGIRGTARSPTTTISPALDVTYPSNWERLASFYKETPKETPAVMKNMVIQRVIDEKTTMRTIEDVWKQYGIMIDPHGAVAFAAARDVASQKGFYDHIVVLATGHAAKYPELVAKVTGEPVSVPDRLQLLRQTSAPCAVIENDLDALETAIAASY
jgi:threonine synthase